MFSPAPFHSSPPPKTPVTCDQPLHGTSPDDQTEATAGYVQGDLSTELHRLSRSLGDCLGDGSEELPEIVRASWFGGKSGGGGLVVVGSSGGELVIKKKKSRVAYVT